MPLTTVAKNKQADAVVYDMASIHTQDPTDNGSVGEVTGGIPAYARQAITFVAAVAGARNSNNAPIFDIPAGVTITHYALWEAGVCVATDALSTAESYGGQGKYTLTNVDVITS